MAKIGATGRLLCSQGPAAGAIASGKTPEELVRQALAERRRVEFHHHGHARRVEPHALGRITEGRSALLGWQVSGGSASEPPPGWRTLVLGEIESLEILRAGFSPRQDYQPASAQLKPIEAEVAQPLPAK